MSSPAPTSATSTQSSITSWPLSFDSCLYRNHAKLCIPPLNERSKQTYQILLEKFIQSTVFQFGIKEPITLFLVNEIDVCRCDTTMRVIYISKEKVKDYGTKKEATGLDQVLDLLPNDPYKLQQAFLEQTKTVVGLFNLVFTRELSDIEIEARILHEIGHINHQDALHLVTTAAEKHQCEYAADLFAYSTPRGLIGMARDFKRELLWTFLSSTKSEEKQSLRADAKKPTKTHPSIEERLRCISLFEQKRAEPAQSSKKLS